MLHFLYGTQKKEARHTVKIILLKNLNNILYSIIFLDKCLGKSFLHFKYRITNFLGLFNGV
jgi:hypothetical protein